MRRFRFVIPIATVIVLAAFAIVGWQLRPSPTSHWAPPAYERVAITKDAIQQAPAPIALKVGTPADGADRAAMSGTPAAQNAASSAASPRRAPASAPQIARTGQMSLYVNNVDNAVSALTALAHREGGDLFSLQVANANADDGAASGTMQIRVISDRFEDTMNAIAQIGKVRSRSVGAQDLTGDISDSQAQLTNLRNTESDIRQIMNRSGEISDVLDAENRLSDVRGQIEQLESQLKTMHTQVSYATIDIALQAEAGSSTVEPNALAQLGTSWQSAVHAMGQMTIGILASLLWLVAFAPYILVAIAAIFIATTVVRRVRRKPA